MKDSFEEMYSLWDLRIITQLNKDRSFTKAAAELYITQPVLSRKLRAIEEKLGIRLFERTTRHLEPTMEGEIVVVHAEEILKRCELLDRSVERLRREQDSLCIGYSSLMEFAWIEEVTGKIHDLGYSMNILSRRWNTLENLQDRIIDAAILNECELTEETKMLEWRLLCPCGLSVFIPRDDPLGKKEKVYLSDLRDRDVVIPSRKQELRKNLGTDYDSVLRSLLVSHGLSDDRISNRLGLEEFSLTILNQRKTSILPDRAKIEINGLICKKEIADVREGFGCVIAWMAKGDHQKTEVIRRAAESLCADGRQMG